MREQTTRAAMMERPMQPEEYARRLRDWRTAAAPYVDLIVSIYARATPTYILSDDGKVTQTSDGLSGQMREQVQFLNKQIALLGRAHGLPLKEE